MEARNLRKERTGVVLSNKMDKTITVAAKFQEKKYDEKNKRVQSDIMCIFGFGWM